MVFLLINFFVEITYQWITVTHLIIATTPFSSFVVPNPGMGVRWDISINFPSFGRNIWHFI